MVLEVMLSWVNGEELVAVSRHLVVEALIMVVLQKRCVRKGRQVVVLVEV